MAYELAGFFGGWLLGCVADLLADSLFGWLLSCLAYRYGIRLLTSCLVGLLDAGFFVEML